MRSSIFVLVAAAAGFTAAACNEKDVADCMLPYISKISACESTACACTNLDKELDCYGDICPGEVFPASALEGYVEVCPSGKYASSATAKPTATGSSDSAPTDGSKTAAAAATTSTAAADMLMIPAGGMVAGLVGVLAWL